MEEVEPDVFEELVRDALDTLPAELDEQLAGVAVVVDHDVGSDGDLGWYEDSGYLPPVVVIARRPLCAHATDLDDLRREVRVTVVHEIGHHFGLDHGRLDELGFG